MMAAEKQRAFTTGDIARIAGVSVRTVTNWIDDGRMPCYRLPDGHRRVERAHLVAFLKAQGMPLGDLNGE